MEAAQLTKRVCWGCGDVQYRTDAEWKRRHDHYAPCKCPDRDDPDTHGPYGCVGFFFCGEYVGEGVA